MKVFIKAVRLVNRSCIDTLPLLNQKLYQEKKVIRTKENPYCHLCGSEGKVICENLQDYLFLVKGEWSLSRCRQPECGLVWINPAPLEEDIHKAYEVYYTHDKSAAPKNAFRNLAARTIRTSYDFLTAVSLLKQSRKKLYKMYLADTPPGKLLEVGCGNGERLAMFQNMGWSVYGQEVDGTCVKNAFKRFGIEIQLGELEDLDFEDNSFDAIVLNHVIEHVHEPLLLMSKCYRLLKPGGVLTVVTPNNESSGLKYFKECWRGLEPPRHIHIFNISSLNAGAVKAGFDSFKTQTTAVNAETIAYGSLRIAYEKKLGGRNRGQKIIVRLMSAYYQILFSLINVFDKSSGEECVLRATKT
jgi:2-polyprenyl-3-methyl-5-hydroxy-6-metoxy-1,4-benzoquinol methylase